MSSGIYRPNNYTVAQRREVGFRSQRRRAGVPGDPFFQSVTLLLHMEGTPGANAFIDSSKYARVMVPYGAAVTSSTQKRFGNTSGSFNGSNAHLRTTAVAELLLDGNFTIETFVYPNSAADMMLAGSQTTGNTQLFRLNENGTAGRLSLYDGSSYVFNSIVAGIAANTWQHIAFARTGTTTRAFVNGSQVAVNTTWAGSLRCDVIGSSWLSGGSSWANAFIDEFRITKGICRYVNAFTAPTAAFYES